MNLGSSTPLRVGQSGTLAGVRYRVDGHGRLGVDEAGETYFWDEFYLTGENGTEATLVYEVVEGSAQWRLFTLFEPEQPLSAAAAARARTGSRLSLAGEEYRVTLVGASRIHELHGQAPEGMEVGDIAHYLNAESDREKIVVSWTREEVEHYRGMDLPAEAIAAGFGVVLPQILPSAPTSTNLWEARIPGDAVARRQWVGTVLRYAVFGIIALVTLGSFTTCQPRRSFKPLPTRPAATSPLSLTRRGALGDRTYEIRGHAVVELATVGHKFLRHEYLLETEDGHRDVLVLGTRNNAKAWVLFRSLDEPPQLSPPQAAALVTGQSFELDGRSFRVTELFQSTVVKSEGAYQAGFDAGNRQFGLVADNDNAPLLLRWSEAGITASRGLPLAESQVSSAFLNAASR